MQHMSLLLVFVVAYIQELLVRFWREYKQSEPDLFYCKCFIVHHYITYKSTVTKVLCQLLRIIKATNMFYSIVFICLIGFGVIQAQHGPGSCTGAGSCRGPGSGRGTGCCTAANSCSGANSGSGTGCCTAEGSCRSRGSGACTGCCTTANSC